MSRRKQENPQPRKRLVNSSDECPSLGLTTTREAIDGREEVDFGDGDGMERMDESEEDGGNEVIYVSNDMLTCGDCQMEFALSDILKFIDHKIVLCSKGNCRPNSKTPDENDDGATEALELEDDGDDREENVDPLVNSNGTSGNGASVKKQTPSIITCSQRQKLKYLQGKGNGQHMCINSQKIHHHHRPCGPGLVNNRTAHATSPGVKQTVDAHTNTINTEPLSLACRTCKQVFHSSWALLQHAQSVHGSQLYIENFSNEPSMLPPIDGQTPGVPHLGASLATGLHIHSNGPSSLSSTHPALSLLRMPSQDRPFPATFLAAAAAAAAVSRPLGGSGPSHSDLFSSSPSSVLNHPVASLLADAHNLFSAAAASETQCGRSGNGTRSLTGTSSLPTPSGHQSSSLSSFEPHIDFYSQRLRQLAGATSPGSARTSVSPVRKLTPPSFPSSVSSAIATTANTAVTTTTCDIQSSNRSGAPSQQQPGSPKHKECEYCGKSFRFMSNLIVHRRSHTGEKPYKCDICNHACTQASKLKRHMKTHYRGSQTAQNVNSVLENTTDSMLSQADSSAGGTPTSGLNNSRTELATTNGGDIDMDDDDIEDEDEDEEEEDLGDEEKEDEDPGEGENSRNSSVEMVAEDLSTGGVGASAKKGTSNGTSYKSNNSPKENSPGAAAGVQSLIGEVMENIGLSGIQQYNEAYKQALEEQVKVGPGGSCGAHNNGSSRGGVKQERPSSSSSHISSIGENGPSLNNLFKHQSPLLSHSNFNDLVGPLGASMNHTSNALGGVSGSLISSAFDHHNPFDPKRLKLDLTSNEHRDPLYAGLWLPAMANPFTASFAHLTSEASSGISAELAVRSKIISESAFNKTSSISANSSPRAGPSLGRGSTPPSANRSSPSSGHNSATPPTTNLTGTPGRKEGGARTRNDTCEYCGKVFKNCSNLTVHRRSHTGEKPYKCELCSYACAQSSKLTRHMKTHGRLGKDVYRCRFCEMPFSVPSTLEKHMRKCVVNQNNNAAANVVASANSSSSNLQLIPCLTSNTSNSNDPGSDT